MEPRDLCKGQRAPVQICTAHTQSGRACRAHAITGARVCRMHGGAAPQVREAAKRRIMAAADPIAAMLISMALDKKIEPAVRAAAGRDLLTRAGVTANAKDEGLSARADGQMLWEEFVQIHRRMVGDAGKARD